MRRVLPLLLLALGCGTPVRPDVPDAGGVDADAGMSSDAGPGSDAGFDAGPGSDAGFDAGFDAGTSSDAGTDAGTVTDAGNPNAYVRGSLSGCWRNVNCPRVFSIAHGGSWTSSIPYDSNAAIAASYADGTDGVKIDVRVTSDDVPVISHSSPLEIYESIDCYNRVIETSTAAQVTACHRVPSTTEKFQRLDDVLNFLRGKMVVQLTVKRTVDFARTIREVHALGAEDFAFLEVNVGDLPMVAALPGASTVFFVVNVGSTPADADLVVDAGFPNAFIVEFDPPVDVGPIATQKLHPNGFRSFTYTNAPSPSVAELKALFDKGYDVVSSQNGPNGVAARQQVNNARGFSPP
jgi:hypothetical protein